jgi:hypothetical protein
MIPLKFYIFRGKTKLISILQVAKFPIQLRFSAFAVCCAELAHFDDSFNFLLHETFTWAMLKFCAKAKLMISSACFMTINLKFLLKQHTDICDTVEQGFSNFFGLQSTVKHKKFLAHFVYKIKNILIYFKL